MRPDVATPARAFGGPRGLLARLTGRPSAIEQAVRDAEIVAQHVREGRFQRSLSLIAGLSSVPSGWEVLFEHYRGSYSQRKMYSPVVISPMLLVAGVAGALNRKAARTVLPAVSLITIGDGLLGFVFHVRGVRRKPGGWRVPIMNIIMGPPVLAPLLFGLSGYLGLIASLLRREDDPRYVPAPPILNREIGWLRLLPRVVASEELELEQDAREGRLQQQLALAAALSAVFSGFEAWYSHYKNNFQYRIQWTPIILTPILFAAGVGAVADRRVARTLLPAASALAVVDGTIGSFYHVRGVLKRPGGVRPPLYNIVYNITYGPPVFAPLLFAASGFMGLLASLLRRK